MLVESEIQQQASILAACVARGEALSRLLPTRNPRRIVFLARGSSANAAAYGAYLIESRARIPAAVVAPSMLQSGSAMDLGGDWLIAVSQSGQTPEIVRATREGRERGAVTVAVTNEPSSPLAMESSIVVEIGAGPERAVPATKTFTSSALVLAMVARALGARLPWIDDVPDLVGSVAVPLNTGLRALVDTRALVVASSGILTPIAAEIGLKLTETSGMVVVSGDGSELLHGPIAALAGLPLLLVWHDAFAGPLGTVRERFEQGGSTVTILGHRSGTQMDVPDDPAAAAFPLAVGGQRLAVDVARERGIDPDFPTNLSKITRT